MRSTSSDAILCSSITTTTSAPSLGSRRPVTPPESTHNDTFTLTSSFATNDNGNQRPVTTTADADTNANTNATTATATSIETSVGTAPMSLTRSNTRSSSDGRLEKRRFFRRNRGDNRRQVSTAGTTTSSLPSDTGSSDDDSIDTVGSLPNEPHGMILSHMISSPTTTTSTSNHRHNNNNNNTSPIPHCPPPATVPGAVAARGRAFGELPQWARIPGRAPANPPTATTPTNATAATPSATGTPSIDYNTSNTPTTTNHATPSHVFVPRRSISESRVSFSSMYPTRSIRTMRSTSNGSNNNRRQQRNPTMLSRSTGSTSFFGNVGNLFSSFRLPGQTSSLLPEAEILDSEKVVYAEIVEPQDEWTILLCSPTLLIYSILLLLLGIMIGRWTVLVPSLAADASRHGLDL